MHFSKIPWTQKTKAALDSLWKGRRSVWFDFDGTVTYEIPVAGNWKYDRATVNFSFGHACAFMGLVPNDNKQEYQGYLQRLGDDKDYDKFFDDVEKECLVRQLDESSEIVKNLGISKAELEDLRAAAWLKQNQNQISGEVQKKLGIRSADLSNIAALPWLRKDYGSPVLQKFLVDGVGGLASLLRENGVDLPELNQPIIMDREVMEFIGYKFGQKLLDKKFAAELRKNAGIKDEPNKSLINDDVIALMHQFQNKQVSGGNKVHIDLITAAPEDFNHGVMRAAVEHYNSRNNPNVLLEIPDIVLGKHFKYQADGKIIPEKRPETGRKWYLMNAFEELKASIITVVGDSISIKHNMKDRGKPEREGGDSAGLRIKRDRHGNPRVKNGEFVLSSSGTAIGENHSNDRKNNPDILAKMKAANEDAEWLRKYHPELLAEVAEHNRMQDTRTRSA